MSLVTVCGGIRVLHLWIAMHPWRDQCCSFTAADCSALLGNILPIRDKRRTLSVSRCYIISPFISLTGFISFWAHLEESLITFWLTTTSLLVHAPPPTRPRPLARLYLHCRCSSLEPLWGTHFHFVHPSQTAGFSCAPSWLFLSCLSVSPLYLIKFPKCQNPPFCFLQTLLNWIV